MLLLSQLLFISHENYNDAELVLFVPSFFFLSFSFSSRKNSLVVRTQLSVRVHAIIGK